jgi:hypothetical protein
MSPIGHKIMAWPATTFAGLAIKARVVQDACGHYWDESYRDCDWDRQMVRAVNKISLPSAPRGLEVVSPV